MVTVSMVTAISAQVDWTVPDVNGNTQYRLQIKEEGNTLCRAIMVLYFLK